MSEPEIDNMIEVNDVESQQEPAVDENAMAEETPEQDTHISDIEQAHSMNRIDLAFF